MSKKTQKKLIQQARLPERKIKQPKPEVQEEKIQQVPEIQEEIPAEEVSQVPEPVGEAQDEQVMAEDAQTEPPVEAVQGDELKEEVQAVATQEPEEVKAESVTKEKLVDEPAEPEVQIKEWKQSEPTDKDTKESDEENTEKKVSFLKIAGLTMLLVVAVAGIILGVVRKGNDAVAVNNGATVATPTAREEVPTPALLPSPTEIPELTEAPELTATPTPKPTEVPELTATPTPVPTEVPEATATPTPIPTEAPEPTVTPTPVVVGDIDVSKYAAYSNKFEGWGIGKNTEHKQPTVWGYDTKYKFDEVGAYYVDKNATEDDKVIYLTFNCGYEVGYTPGFLEVLKKHDVKATFFVLEEYIRQCPEEIRWLMENGHLVGSHSAYHLNYGTDTPERIIADMLKNEQRMRDYVGLEMHKVMRPPSGYYNEQTLHIMKDLGYKTYFWSMAYADWDPGDQPSEEYILNYFKAYHHNGAIPVIHITSGAGMKVLDEVITMLKAEGYRFGLVTEIE